jgi:DNA-binding response OmpR family regulator
LLVVEDSDVVRDRLVALLSDALETVIVEWAPNGADALAALRRGKHRFVVLDLHLPDRSGLDVLREAKSFASPPVVVILTSHPSEAHRKQCAALGADFFFDKAVHFELVVDVVNDVEGARRRWGVQKST